MEEKTLASELIYNGKIIDVYKDEVELSDGKKSIREVVRHNGGVVILALKNDDTILMVNQYRYPIAQISLELPAGKLEKGEDPFKAAQRELEEETGYIAEIWTNLGYIQTSIGFCDEKLYLYLAEKLTYTKPNPDEGEILKISEYKLSEVTEMIKKGHITDAKTICSMFKAKLAGINL